MMGGWRTRTVVAVPACVLLAGLATAASALALDDPPRLLVIADEWSFTLSRQTIAPGKAVIQLSNRGEDAHDLHIRRIGGERVTAVPETGPGGLSEVERRLKPGRRYRLTCSLPGHKQLGMRSELRVSDAD